MTQTPQAAAGDVHPAGPRATAVRELLARTVELPSSKRELLAVLGEYRALVSAFAADDGDPWRGQRPSDRADVLRRHPTIICEVARRSEPGRRSAHPRPGQYDLPG
jgi:hypothetical protein